MTKADVLIESKTDRNVCSLIRFIDHASPLDHSPCFDLSVPLEAD